jgi:hypothetical protein
VGKEKESSNQCARRGVALLTLSFLPKTVFVPVFETESSYPKLSVMGLGLGKPKQVFVFGSV